MAAASEVATYLATLGLGTLASTLFVNDLPMTPDVCGAVYDSGGARPDQGFGTAGIKYENATVQVKFRGAPNDSAGPLVKARQAYAGLTLQVATLAGVRYLTLTPLQPPFKLDRDEKNRIVWAFNAIAKKEPS